MQLNYLRPFVPEADGGGHGSAAFGGTFASTARTGDLPDIAVAPRESRSPTRVKAVYRASWLTQQSELTGNQTERKGDTRRDVCKAMKFTRGNVHIIVPDILTCDIKNQMDVIREGASAF